MSGEPWSEINEEGQFNLSKRLEKQQEELLRKPRPVPSWDAYFLAIAVVVATRSKDPWKQVGCVVVNPYNRTIVSGGYNGMVVGVDEKGAWEDKERTWLCHAELNAIALAARNGAKTESCFIYVTRFPCLPCARLIIQAGIIQVITPVHTVGKDNLEEIVAVKKLFSLANINYIGEVHTS